MSPPEHTSLESVPAAVMVVSGDAVVYANAECARLLGRDRAEMLGHSVAAQIDAFVDPGDRPSVQEHNRARIEGRPTLPSFWMRVESGHGRQLTVLVRSQPGPREGEITYLLLERPPDTLTARLTEALSAASWALVPLRDEASVLAAAADALAALDFKVVLLKARGDQLVHVALRQDPARVAEVEQRAGAPMRDLPLSRDEAHEFDACLRERRARFIPDTHALVDRFRPPEIAALIKAAMPRRSAIAPIFVEGEPYGLVTVQHDALSPPDVGQLELFAHRVGSALENVRLQHRLLTQERLATLGETAAVLAHEVRNPVGTILNALALLRRQGTHSEPMRIAEEEAQRLERLVNDLLHLARPLEPRLVELDLVALATRSIDTVRGRLESSEVELRLEAGAPVSIPGDSFLLGLALENLLLNALRVSRPRSQVRISVEPTARGAQLAVDDTGPGIRPEIAARIFEPFFTTHATGTGLGLAVVRKVAEAHRGQVRATRSPLGGARFELELPR